MARFNLTSQKIELGESDVAKQCVQLLQVNRFYPLRLQSGRFIMPDKAVVEALKRLGIPYRIKTVGEVGIPDYVIPRFFLETKAPGEKLEPQQSKKIWELDKFWGLETLVIDNVETLDERLKYFKP